MTIETSAPSKHDCHGGRGSGYSACMSNGKLSKGRRRGVRALVALGAIFSFLAIFSVWLERQVLNTDDWVRTSAELIEDEAVRTAVADYLVDELYANVDMEAELEKILPNDLEGLAGPAAGGLRQGAGQATERILRTNTAQDLWEAANRTAHQELVVVLEGGNERVSTEGGVVTLDLGGMLRDLGRQIGLSGSLTSRIPADAARVEVLRSDELKTAQQVSQGIKGLALVLCLLALLCFGGAVYLSRGQRWVALLLTACGLIAAAFAVLIVRRIAGNLAIDQLVDDPGVKPAAEAAWAIGTSLLAAIATSVIVFALLLALAAWLAAPAPSSQQTRRFLAPGLRDHVAYFYAGLAVITGLYLLIAPSQSLRSLLTLVVIVALSAFGIRELRRTTNAEFPDAPPWTGLERLRTASGTVFRRVIERGRRALPDHGPDAADRETDGPQGTPGSPAKAAKKAAKPGAGFAPVPPSPASATAATAALPPPTETLAPQPSAPAPEPQAPPPGPTGEGDDLDLRLARLERLASLHERGILTDEELAAEKARLLSPGSDLT